MEIQLSSNLGSPGAKRTSQRPPRSCFECAKRRVKCTQVIPCKRCVQKGLGHQCSREPVQLSGVRTKHKDEIEFLTALLGSSLDDILASLQDRLSLLETGFRKPQQSSSISDKRHIDTESEAIITSKLFQHEDNAMTPGPLLISGGLVESLDVDDLIQDSGISQAATTLEHLAWGRRLQPSSTGLKNPLDLPRMSSTLSVQPDQVLKLPPPYQARELIRFHITYVCWHHNAIHAPTFLDQCQLYWDTGETAEPLWMALYLSVLSTSAWCLPNRKALSILGEENSKELAASYYSAMISELNNQNFLSNHSISSIQAIVISTLVAHVLGHSDLHIVLISSGIRIAQCLGIDKQPGKILPEPSCAVTWNQKVKNQTERRAWWQLVIQDYFAVPFANTYVTNPNHFSTAMPMNCDDHDLEELPITQPTISSYCIALAKIASLMPELVDGNYCLRNPIPLDRRYKHVLEMDLKMRNVVAALPAFLMRGTKEDPDWPPWVAWARNTLTISAADKIIMIHRSFMIRSFRSSLYAYTRTTCLSAALTILREYARVREMDVAAIWIVPTFAITAGILVLLDLIHKLPSPGTSKSDADKDEDSSIPRQLAQEVVNGLARDTYNCIAVRGAKILKALLDEEQERRGVTPMPSDTVPTSTPDKGISDGTVDKSQLSDGSPQAIGTFLRHKDSLRCRNSIQLNNPIRHRPRPPPPPPTRNFSPPPRPSANDTPSHPSYLSFHPNLQRTSDSTALMSPLPFGYDELQAWFDEAVPHSASMMSAVMPSLGDFAGFGNPSGDTPWNIRR